MNTDLNQVNKSSNTNGSIDIDSQRQSASFRASLFLGVMALAILAFGITNVIPLKNWLRIGTLFVVLCIAVSAFASAWLNRSKYNEKAVTMMLVVLWLGALAGVSMTSGLGLMVAVGIFTLSIGISVLALPVDGINRSILVGTVVSVVVLLVDFLLVYPRDPASPGLQNIMPYIIGLAVLLFLVFLVRRYSQIPLLTKIVIPFLVVSLLSIGTLSAYNYVIYRRSLVEGANQILHAAALQTSAEVENFLLSIAEPLRIEATLPAFKNYLSVPETERVGSQEEKEALSLLSQFQNRENVLSYSIISRQGSVLLSTLAPAPDQLADLSIYEDIERAQPGALAVALLTAEVYVSPVIYDQESNEPSLYFVMSMMNQSGTPSGFLVSQYSARLIQTDIFVALNGLAGEGSYGELINEDNLRLAHGNNPALVDTLIVPMDEANYQSLLSKGRLPNKPIEDRATNNPDFRAGLERIVGVTTTSMFTTLEGEDQEEFNAVAVPLQSHPWKIVFLQPQSILLEPVNTQLRTTTLFVVLISSIAILASALIARAITRPVNLLTNMATRISQGELDSRLPITSQDEIGSLSSVFNNMTDQLQQTLEGLEQRVTERTRDLGEATAQAQDRARQLEIISEISRVIATEREPEQLLQLVVRMISEQMGFYHCGIFLLDAQKDFAVLQAANSTGGQRMLERGHRLRVGQQGIIGYVTSTGKPRVALDVGADAVFFNNPDLPETRSEMGLPLRSGDQIIGALDVQSTVASAFTDEDVSLLSTLADQVSIAIENALLFSETTRALNELQAVQRQYLREQWDKTVEKRRQVGFIYERGRVVPIPSESEYAVIIPGDIASQHRPGHLTIPISLRGELIGTIDLTELDKNRAWSEEEISLAQSVAEQIGLALENARLIEESQHRAERESLVSQISTRLRASNDPQEILQTAVAELRHALRARTAHIVVPTELMDSGKSESQPADSSENDSPPNNNGSEEGK